MRRIPEVALVLMMAIGGCMPVDGDLASSDLELVPDPGYRPSEGQRASLYGVFDGQPLEVIPVLSDMTAYDKYERCVQNDDPVELERLEKQSWLQYVALGTPVYIMKIADRQHAGGQVGAEVKILEGPQKGRIVWTPITNLARLKRPEPQA